MVTVGYRWLPLATTGYHWLPLATTSYRWLPAITIDYHLSGPGFVAQLGLALDPALAEESRLVVGLVFIGSTAASRQKTLKRLLVGAWAYRRRLDLHWSLDH